MPAGTALRIAWAASATLLLVVSSAPVQAQEAAEPVPADRIMAIVDEDPILLSDMQRLMSLGLVPQQDEESTIDYERRVLDQLIDHKLRFHEVDRFGVQLLPIAEIEEQYREIAARYPNLEEFEDALAQMGLSSAQLRELLARQLMVLSFIEERLGPRVFVSLADIQEYYDSTLVPEMERRGETTPEIGEVRESIRSVLREERLNREIVRWTEELRLRADVVDHFDRPSRPLPPPVEQP